MIIDIYQIYSEKSIRKNIIFKYACVFSVILAVGLLFSMQNVLDVYNSNLSHRIEAMNGADVKVLDRDYLEHEFSQEQLLNLEKEIEKVNYTLAYCNNSNLVVQGKDDMVAITIFNKEDIISKFGINSLDESEIVISNNIAERLKLHIGDQVYVKLHSDKYRDDKFRVTQILDDNAYFSVAGSEYEVAQETLGCAYIVLHDFERFNTAYVENGNERVINILESTFGSTFEVRTLRDLKNIVRPRIQMQMGVIKLISSIAMIISNICLIWTFFIFIMDRKADFLIFKKVGMRTSDLSKLILLEIYSIVIKGILLGIPFGGLATSIYFQINGIVSDFTMLFALKNIIIVIGTILIETAIFALIPVSSINKIVNSDDFTIAGKTTIFTIMVVGIVMILLSCIYMKSFIGIIFLGIIGTIFLLFYLVFITLIKVITKILFYNRKLDFLFCRNLKNDIKIISMPLNIINVGMVILLILLDVLPILYSPLDNGTIAEKQNISYRTSQVKRDVEDIFREKNINYYKSYIEEIKILEINGVDVEQYINPNIAEVYKEESIEEFCNREINVYEKTHALDELHNIDGIYINNIYKNIVDFRENDQLTILINEERIYCQVGGIYEDAYKKNTLGIISESYMEELGYNVEKFDMTVIYTLPENISNHIATEILFIDKNAYIDRNQQLSNYFKKYIDRQKVVFISIIVAVGFSGVLLVLLGQIILLVRKKEYYVTLWKIGMSKHYLIKSLLSQKFLLSFIQMIVITIFLEPIRFLINGEVTSGKYHISVSILIIELIIILGINLLSVVLPFSMRQKE